MTRLEIVGAGLTFLVYRADSAAFGPVAIRVAWRRAIADDNDGVVEARRLVRQEAAPANHARARGLPSSSAHALHLGDDGFAFLVSTRVPHDGSPPDGRAFGRLVRAIHECPAPTVELVGQGGLPPSRLIGERLARRARALGRPAAHHSSPSRPLQPPTHVTSHSRMGKGMGNCTDAASIRSV